jgi:hypothetical protein
VLIPNLLATSKTMSATLIGLPPFWILFGVIVAEAFKGKWWAIGAWLVPVVLAALTLDAASIPSSGWGYSKIPGFAGVMREHLWVLWHMLAAGAGAIVGWFLDMKGDAGRFALGGRERGLQGRPRAKHRAASFAFGLSLIVSISLFLQPARSNRLPGYVPLAWNVTQINKNEPDFAEFAAFAQRLPDEAVFLVHDREKLQHLVMMFAADRTCYAVKGEAWRDAAQNVIDAGGVPFLVTGEPQHIPAVFDEPDEQQTVYACTPKAKMLADEGHPRE